MIQKHGQTQFPLMGRHQSADCQSCHPGTLEQRFVGTPITCAGCHITDYQATSLPNHAAVGFGTDCESCHGIATPSWAGGFNHDATGFPLTGAHIATDCASCHKDAVFDGTPTECVACHQGDFAGTDNPQHASAGFSTDCATCHNTSSWDGATFDHSQTDFPLTGKHQNKECRACHGDNLFAGKPTDCFACHANDFSTAQDPAHTGPGFSTDCVDCHTTAGWKPADFDHNATAFPLTGEHAETDCQSCHVNNNYQLVYTDCFQCHQANFQSASSPNHVAGGFSHDCTPCHSTTSWSPATFDHSQTAFQLTGAHVMTACQSCHVSGNYQLTYTDCYACHQSDYDGVASPNHVLGSFNHDCTPCHTTSAWTPTPFDHNQTGFPLTGVHITTECQSCHVNGNYQLVFADCYQCHQSDYAVPQEPNHVAGNFSHDCQPCHTTTSWSPSTFDHNTTPFPLTGAHATVVCSNCHVNNQYVGLGTACYDCHADDFNSASNPNHLAGGFTTDCTQCHSTTGWSPALFDHAQTGFPLTGAHVTTQCQSCHVNGNYQLVYTDCYQCHQSDFDAVVSPNHVSANFSHDCTPCHSTTAWLPSTFDHGQTAFPLTGAHLTTTCQSCHVNGNYQLVYTDCFQCHQTDFEGAQSPNHVAGNFSHDCTTCHSTTAWAPASFDHTLTAFPLTGAHITATCQSCHIDGNYQLVFTNCYQCHQLDFQTPLEPNHVAGNFSHDCTPCHTTTSWLPSTFSHNDTAFPLTGAHQAVVCSNCHVNNQYQGLSTVCFDCHTDDFNGATNPNHITGGFPTDCVQCHTTTAWSPASFDHNLTGFPLTGAHIPTACQSCHVDGNYQLVYTDCYQCHQTDYELPTDPNHVALQFSHDCTPCHTTTAWLPSTFDHDGQYFRIYSGAHRDRWTSCSECHPVPNDYAQFTCTTACHEQGETDDQHQGVTGYVYSSPACYDCHRNAMARGVRSQ
jgi:mRNA-degrading endonuclease YafQ of YafQ-DinJ toxin-antitoxin module